VSQERRHALFDCGCRHRDRTTNSTGPTTERETELATSAGMLRVWDEVGRNEPVAACPGGCMRNAEKQDTVLDWLKAQISRASA
jgi:hypothetical protein